MREPDPLEFKAIRQPLRGKEDRRPLTGKGRFTDGCGVDVQARAVMMRSPHTYCLVNTPFDDREATDRTFAAAKYRPRHVVMIEPRAATRFAPKRRRSPDA